jgi:hypothetical protein
MFLAIIKSSFFGGKILLLGDQKKRVGWGLWFATHTKEFCF